MKRYNLSFFLLLCLGGWAVAAPPKPTVFVNNTPLTIRTNINDNVVVNNSLVFFDTVGAGIVDNMFFYTQNTLNFTNSITGTMVAQPGFIFNNESTTTGSHPASSFNDGGTIIAVDAQTAGFAAIANAQIMPIPSLPPGTGGVGVVTGGTAPILDPAAGPGINAPVSSALQVSATNISISGAMSVGELGLLQLNGANINLNGGSLEAGFISELDANATVSRGVTVGYITGVGAVDAFYSPPAGVYDIYWSAANGASELGDIAEVYDTLVDTYEGEALDVETGFPYVGVNGTVEGGSRNGTVEGYSLVNYHFYPYYLMPISSATTKLQGPTPTITSPAVTPNFVPYVFSENYGTTDIATNVYDIVFVNEAFADSNITVEVQFSDAYENTLLENPDYLGNEFQFEPMIKFSAPVLDALTGQIVSNSIYLLDTAGIQQPAVFSTNSLYAYSPTGYAKPLAFEITTHQPVEWTNAEAFPANDNFLDAEAALYASGEFQNETTTMTNSWYAAQVDRNPEQRDGLFDYTATLLGTTVAGFPDITNEPARIEINASGTNDVTNLRLRANGFLNLTATNLVGRPLASDFGNYNLNLGNLKNSLFVSNLVPTTFNRLRGDIVALTYDWMNTQTNNGVSTNRVTNYFMYHVLFVDQDLRSTFQTTGLNVALRGSNVVVDDSMRIMGAALVQAPNLALNAGFHLTGAAGALQNTTVPGLQNLLIGTNGSLTADNSINLGVAASAGTVTVTSANTPILTITNRGLVNSAVIEVQSRIFANGGKLLATNNGSIAINAMTNYLGSGALGLTNSLTADVNVSLDATSIQITNSTIIAGRAGNGQLVLHATGELTDHVPNTASTNSYSTNFWQTTAGFFLPVKPASGDLFGTTIKTVAAIPYQTIDHVWAATNLGPVAAGFHNNEVIGHLILDRKTNATLRFSPAGKSNAMYVDFLELQDLSLSDYHNGLVIDTNFGFTIYFANANVDPQKLQQVYPNLVWAPQFAGPNSSTNVLTAPLAAGGSNILMNAALATSSSISSAYDGIGNANSGGLPLYNPAVGPVPNPARVTSAQAVTNAVGGQIFVVWTVGQGSIKTNLSLNGAAVGQTVSLTAKPSANWLFLDWSGPVVTNKNTVVSGATISFLMPANPFSFVTANFITNPFVGLAGVYNGLFAVPGDVTANNSGFVTFTLNSQGVFSGKLLFGTTNYPFSSQFYITQNATASATNGANVMAVALQFGEGSAPNEATGSVTNANFTASLAAYQVPAWTAAHPAPQEGSYTLVLLGNANAAASPGGDSYGTVTVDALGHLTAKGTLADNVPFSQSVPLSQGGQWPLYMIPAGIAQPLLGWVSFDTNGAGGTPAGFSGTVTWVKHAKPGTLYPNGFTNSSVLLGSAYSAAAQKAYGLGLSNPVTVTLSGGNLAAPVSETVGASGLQTYQTADKKTLTLTIVPATGAFSGQYVAPGTTKKVPLAGMVLQYQDEARGFFLGTSQSGSVLLQGN